MRDGGPEQSPSEVKAAAAATLDVSYRCWVDILSVTVQATVARRGTTREEEEKEEDEGLCGVIKPRTEEERGRLVVGLIRGAPHVALVILSVRKSHRCCGIGSALLQRYEEAVARHTLVSHIRFTCASFNAVALGMYGRRGYTLAMSAAAAADHDDRETSLIGDIVCAKPRASVLLPVPLAVEALLKDDVDLDVLAACSGGRIALAPPPSPAPVAAH